MMSNEASGVCKEAVEVFGADVEIMLEQLKYIHKCHQNVNCWRRKKIMRLAGYIEGERLKGQNSERRS